MERDSWFSHENGHKYPMRILEDPKGERGYKENEISEMLPQVEQAHKKSANLQAYHHQEVSIGGKLEYVLIDGFGKITPPLGKEGLYLRTKNIKNIHGFRTLEDAKIASENSQTSIKGEKYKKSSSPAN